MNAFKSAITSCLAVLFGILLLGVVDLSPRWVISFVGLFGLVSCAALFKNSERLFLGLLFATFPLPIANFFGELPVAHRGGPPGYFVMLSDFPLAMLCLLWVPQLVSGSARKIILSPATWCLLSIMGISALSVWNAVDPRFSCFELVRLVVVLLFYLYMANSPAVSRHLSTIFTTLMVGLCLEGALGVTQFASGKGVGLRLTGPGAQMVRFEGFLRAGGTLGHPNTFALYLGLLLPVALSLLVAARSDFRRLLNASAFILGSAGMMFTFSRGGWLGFALSMFIWSCLVLRFGLVRWNRLAAVIGLALIVFAGVVVPFRDLVLTRLFADDYGSAYSRIPLMQVAFNMIRTHPFIGVGINNYLLVMSQYDNTPEGIGFHFQNVVHNGYLLIASEIGIPGLLCFLGLAGFVGLRGWRFLARSRDRELRLLVAGLLAGFASIFLQMLVENVYLTYHSMLLFWILAGIVEGVSRLETQPAGWRLRPARLGDPAVSVP